jgi:hypothetical protein
LNYWKQTSHVLKYFRAEEEPKARLPSNFINGFLEVCCALNFEYQIMLIIKCRVATKQGPDLEIEKTKHRSVYIAETIPFPSCAPFPCYL